MRKTIKITLLVIMLALAQPLAWGFALLGPLLPNAGGEPWQVQTIGYNLIYAGGVGGYYFALNGVFSAFNEFAGGPVWLGDIGGPHNLGEEYRRVTPYMFYAYDQSYLDYFGLAGTTNCDAAFAIMNSLTNVSAYSAGVTEFPPTSQAFNPTAQSLYLLDIKSVTLHLLVEQLGLAEPERYTWTLHDRFLGNSCPVTTSYLVVQRNFDILNTPLNQVQYSPYVNGILYSYFITERCNAQPVPPAEAETWPFATDFTVSAQYTAVAANDNEPFGGLQIGGFYTGLTQDDVAGLRYLMNSNNINYESTALAGGRILATNTQAPITLTTLPLNLLFSQSATNDPATLQALYPGLSFVSVQTNYVNLISTNLIAYFTNLAGPYTNNGPNFTSWAPVQYGAFTNSTTLSLGDFIGAVSTNDPATLQGLYPNLLISSALTNSIVVQVTTNIAPYYTNQVGLPVYTNTLARGLTNGYYFTNQPGPTIINYPLTSTLLNNVDLYQFNTFTRTNDPATVAGQFPGIVILSYYSTPTNTIVPNVFTYFTNYVGSPVGSIPTLVTVTNGYNNIFYNLYTYQFGNVITNHIYNLWLINQTTSVSNHVGSPVGNAYVTSQTTSSNSVIGGDLLIIPTNWCGFQVTYTYAAHPTTVSNIIFTTSTVGGSGGTNIFAYTQSVFYTYTNYAYNITPGICEPVLAVGTNYFTNLVNQYQYSFGNVVTNHYYTNTFVRIYSTNVYSLPGSGTNLATNVAPVISYYTNWPSGDIFIVPTSWCGYSYTTLLTNVVSVTNFFTAGGLTNGAQYYNQLTINYYTNYTWSLRPGFCEPALALITNYSTNLATTYSYYFGGIITNHFYPNTYATVVTTNLLVFTNGPVGWLTTNNITTNLVNIGPGGDFFVIPPQYCGLNILSTLSTGPAYITNQFIAADLANPDLGGERYSQTTYSSYTNTTFVVQPQVCSTIAPAPNLRRGIERVQFVRANYDSLIGQYFAPITNYYTMIVITNSQQVTEYYQRIITQPDIRLSAQDFADGPAGVNFNGTAVRNITYDSSQILNGLHGPGVIYGASQFSYNKVGPIFQNGLWPDTNSYVSYSALNQTTQIPLLQWASYDASTNLPILYPNGSSIANLANSIWIQVLPAADPLNPLTANHNSYYSQTFTATGGQPPYTWSAPNITALVPGLNFNNGSQTLYGTPAAAGTYTFSIQLTDSVNRTVNFSYTITVQ